MDLPAYYANVTHIMSGPENLKTTATFAVIAFICALIAASLRSTAKCGKLANGKALIDNSI